MKLLVVVALVAVAVAAAAAAPPQTSQQRPQRQTANLRDVVQLLKFISDNDGLGKYNYAYEQSDGRRQEEQGELRNPGAENEAIAVQGSYGWVGPDGVTYSVNYIADDNGFQPTIDQGPGGAVPAAVLASLLTG